MGKAIQRLDQLQLDSQLDVGAVLKAWVRQTLGKATIDEQLSARDVARLVGGRRGYRKHNKQRQSPQSW